MAFYGAEVKDVWLAGGFVFCKPEVKLILEGLQAERENGRDQTGLSADIENNRGIQEGALCSLFLHNANIY